MFKLKIKKFLDITRLWKYVKLRIYRHPATVDDLSMSIALGVFIGILPTFTLASVLSILAAGAFRLPKLPCFLGTLIANPYTTPFFLTFSYKIGNFFFKREFARSLARFSLQTLKDIPMKDIFVKFYYFYTPLLLGGILIALPASIITYYLFFFSITGFRKAREKKKRKNKD